MQIPRQVFIVESTDVGDGRVRVCVQLSETATSRTVLTRHHAGILTSPFSLPLQSCLRCCRFRDGVRRCGSLGMLK